MIEAELRELVKTTQFLQAEQQTVEVKSAHQGCPERLYDTLSSFSNQDEGGVIIFGLDETQAFQVVGVYDPQDLQKRVVDQCEQMEPIVRPLFTMAVIDEFPVLAAEIPSMDASERPCYYKGRGRIKGAYCRVGESDRPMTEYEIYSYEAFRKKYQDDVRVLSGVGFDVIDRERLSNYLQIIKVNRPNLASQTDEQICKLMGLTKNSEVTLASQLLFGLYPQAIMPQLCIIATVVPGTEIGDTSNDGVRFIDNKRIEGTLPSMLNEALSFVRTNMKMSTTIDNVTGERRDTYEYPLVAIREALVNALIHRDYSMHTEGMPIELTLYADRLEIVNPGGLYGRIRIDELGKTQADTRNPTLAVAAERIGLTENRYSGIPTIRKQMREAGLPEPIFLDSRSSFKVIFKNEAASSALSTSKDAALGKNKSKHRVKGKDSSEDLESMEDMVLAFCKEPRTREEITDMLGLASQAYAMKRYVMPLVEKGKLKMSDPEHPRKRKQWFFC